MAVVRYNLFFRIARIDGRLEYFYALFGEFSAFQTADQFFRLTGEH